MRRKKINTEEILDVCMARAGSLQHKEPFDLSQKSQYMSLNRKFLFNNFAKEIITRYSEYLERTLIPDWEFNGTASDSALRELSSNLNVFIPKGDIEESKEEFLKSIEIQ